MKQLTAVAYLSLSLALCIKEDGSLGIFDSAQTVEYVPTAVPVVEPPTDTTGDKAA